MKRLMLLTSAFAFSASMAMASISANDLVAAYQAQGYSKIEVTTGLSQIKVEAVKGTAKVEVVYDATTGAILRQHAGWAKRSERGNGVALSSASDDFTSGADDSETGSDEVAGDDEGAGHDMNDDNQGSDNNSNHGSQGDNGGHDDNSGEGSHSDGEHGGNDD